MIIKQNKQAAAAATERQTTIKIEKRIGSIDNSNKLMNSSSSSS